MMLRNLQHIESKMREKNSDSEGDCLQLFHKKYS